MPKPGDDYSYNQFSTYGDANAAGAYYQVGKDRVGSRTYGDDLDPLDVLVLCSEPLEPLTLVRCYPIGMISMIDSGRNDEKIIAIPVSDPTYNTYTDIKELPGHIFEEMQHFFRVYKNLEGKDTAVNEVSGRDSAVATIAAAIESYIQHFCKG